MVLFLAACNACSVFGGNDVDTKGTGGGLPPGAPPPLTGSPSEDQLTERFGVFVSAAGTAEGDGSRQRPVSTLARGIELAKPQAKRVYVCNGTYAEALVVTNTVSVIGGFDCADATTWKKTDERAVVRSPSSPAVRAADIAQATRLEGLEIVAPDGAEPSASSIGLLATDAPKLTIASCRIEAGKGVDGEAGVTPTALVSTTAFDGKSGHVQGPYCVNRPFTVCNSPVLPDSPSGGVGNCGGGIATEPGGAGGSGGVYKSTYSMILEDWLWQAQGAANSLAAKAGEARAGTDGSPGANGASGASPAGSLSRDGFLPADGTAGSNGAPGLGGRGGNGSLPPAPPDYPSSYQNELWEGITGGSGGAGGCPGLAGTPGKGGGASLAAVLFASPVAFVGSTLVAHDGGAGGKGSIGTSPTVGGKAGSTPNEVYIKPKPVVVAAPGGRGGPAGFSGSGAGGPSLGIAHTNGVPTLEGTSVTVAAGGKGVPEEKTTDAAGYDHVLPASPDGLSVEQYTF